MSYLSASFLHLLQIGQACLGKQAHMLQEFLDSTERLRSSARPSGFFQGPAARLGKHAFLRAQSLPLKHFFELMTESATSVHSSSVFSF